MFKLKSQRGFTLVELLIVIAVLGVMAAVAVPNMGSFLNSANIAGANTEAANVKTAYQSYLADNGFQTADVASSVLSPTYLSGTLRASYTIDYKTGLIKTPVDATITNGWGTAVEFNIALQKWQKGTTGKDFAGP